MENLVENTNLIIIKINYNQYALTKNLIYYIIVIKQTSVNL